jgi:hypothetical protein
MESTDVVSYSGHVGPELSPLNWFETIHGNVINKLSAVGLIRAEEAVVA